MRGAILAILAACGCAIALAAEPVAESAEHQASALACHGAGLADNVQETLRLYYPDDWATGYTLGQVRGAISLSRPL